MSKLGTHTSLHPSGLGDFLKRTAEAGSPVPFLFELDINVQPDVAQYSPTTELVFRTQKFGADNGNMYTGDPIVAGRDRVDVCYPIWKLNPANYYTPINEPGRNDPDGLTWLCDFYIGCMQRADELGIKLCVGEWSSGMPPVEYATLYVPMLRYAQQHGHVLGLHEYSLENEMIGSPLCLRYRQLWAALPADARVPIYITESGPGAGYNTGYSGQPYVDVVGAYDLEVMKDAYVRGVALFKLGTGESDMAEVMPLLTQWVVEHPQEEQAVTIIGVHSRAGGGDLTLDDRQNIVDAMPRLNGVKFTTQDARPNHALVKSLGVTMANCIVRIFWDSSNVAQIPSPQQFYNDVCALPIQEAIADGVTWFEFLNEPNLTSEWKWGISEFVTFAKAVIALIRQNNQTAKIISPGLNPSAATVPAWDQAFADSGLYGVCDGIGAHAYGTQPAHLNDDNEMRYYRRFANRLTGTQKIWITEASLKFYSITEHEVGLLYGEYATTLESYVAGVYFFVLQGTAFESSGEEWVTHHQIAHGLSNYQPTTTEREFDHWEDADTGSVLGTTNPLSLVVTANRRIKAVTRPKQVIPSAYTVSVMTDGYGAVTGGGTYTAGQVAVLTWSPS